LELVELAVSALPVMVALVHRHHSLPRAISLQHQETLHSLVQPRFQVAVQAVFTMAVQVPVVDLVAVAAQRMVRVE
jgi:hypothetical protein